MKYERTLILKNGKSCLLRSAGPADAEALLGTFIRTHEETDYLLTYPEENGHTTEEEQKFLEGLENDDKGIEILAFVDGKAVGSAGINRVGAKEKIRHRAEFGISVEKAYWGLGIGRALTKACIDCAKEAGYSQMELEVVSENRAAISLYESVGFKEYGRNPKGFRSRITGWQELVLMRLELE